MRRYVESHLPLPVEWQRMSYNVLILANEPTGATSECHLQLAMVSHQMWLQLWVGLQGLTGDWPGRRLESMALSSSC